MRPPSRRTATRWLLAALLVVGTAARLRLYASCPSYWYDEAYLLLNVFHKSCLDLLGPLRDDQAAPPLFLAALRGLYLLGGGGECWMRLPAAAASVAGLLLLVPLARRVAGRRGLPWAVALGALCHHAVAHACEVKPYALDFLLAELVLLAAVGCLGRGRRALCLPSPPLRGRGAGGEGEGIPREAGPPHPRPLAPRRGERGAGARLWPPLALCALAVLAPWASFPAVFVVGAAGLALLAEALRRRRPVLLALGGAVGVLLLLSGLSLWQLSVRHQATAGLRQFWQVSFLDVSSPRAALAGAARCVCEVGHYGTREMGLPLALLALAGAASLRRRPARVVLLGGPLALALVASALRLYPLGGRLLFFLVPSLWLLAARGVATLSRRLPPRLAPAAVALPAVLLVPEALSVAQTFVAATPRAQFREAFAHVHRRRAACDALWVSHPQVYQVYHGAPPPLGAYSPAAEVERRARTGRLWLVCTVTSGRGALTAPGVVGRVAAAGVLLERRRFKGVEVALYAPPGTPSATNPLAPAAPRQPPPAGRAAQPPAARPAVRFSAPRAAAKAARHRRQNSAASRPFRRAARFAPGRHFLCLLRTISPCGRRGGGGTGPATRGRPRRWGEGETSCCTAPCRWAWPWPCWSPRPRWPGPTPRTTSRARTGTPTPASSSTRRASTSS